jgi:hypothetical protein
MAHAGIDGVIFSAIDYIDVLQRLDHDVLPSLVENDVRQTGGASSLYE